MMMQCPVCDERLRAVEKYGVEVDICPGCKGVWLDRGELDKILQYAEAGGPTTDAPAREPRREAPREFTERPRAEYDDRPRGAHEERRRDYDGHDRHDDRRYDERQRGYPPHGQPKRRGSWLSDIFEGFGGDD